MTYISKVKKAQGGLLLLTIVLSSVLLLSAALVLWGGNITGYQSLNTFETDDVVTGSSGDSSLRFEQIPNFIVKVGEHVEFKVRPNADGVTFTDDTDLFDIDENGFVEFTPKEDQIGHHRILIFIKKDNSKLYFQDVHIIIEENQ